MAHLEDLIAKVESPDLRDGIAEEARELKKRTRFGLVFERHIPEAAVLAPSVGLAVGGGVRLRCGPDNGRRLVVEAVRGKKATVRDDDGKTEGVGVDQLMVVKGFGEPIYPTLAPIGTVNPG